MHCDEPVTEPLRVVSCQAAGACRGVGIALLESHHDGDALGGRRLSGQALEGFAEDLVAFLIGRDNHQVVDSTVAGQLAGRRCPVAAAGELKSRQANEQTGGELTGSPQPVGGERDQKVAK